MKTDENHPVIMLCFFIDELVSELHQIHSVSYTAYATYVKISAYVFSGTFTGEILYMILSTYFIGNAFHVG